MMGLLPHFLLKTTSLALLLLLISSDFVLAQEEEGEGDDDAAPKDTEISYVMEPFEDIDPEWFFSTDDANLTVVSAESALFGQGALMVGTSKTSGIAATTEFGWILPDRPHNCHGAKYLSLWTKVEASSATIRLSMLDDHDCVTNTNENLACNEQSQLVTSLVIEKELPYNSNNWQQLLVSTSEIADLNLSRLRGWMVEIENSNAGPVYLDQLSCIGGGEMLGAAFFTGLSTYQQAHDEGTWFDEFYQSDVAKNESRTSLDPTTGHLNMDYVVEQTELWGGFNDVAHLAPGNAYYNLSDATGLLLDYDILRTASIPDRCIFRLVIQDGSHCVDNCTTDYHATERWYSFHSIMDDAGPGKIAIPLVGGIEATAPLWLTGWSGITGNQLLDTHNIQGFTLEVVLDSILDLGTFVDGSVSFFNMAAAILPASETNFTNLFCSVEEDLYILDSGPQMTRIEFLGSQCCEVCANDPECLYALSTGRDCYVASSVDPDHVGLISNELDATTHVSFWMDDEVKRGGWCERCDCDERARTIDCRGRNLAILPKSFNLTWTPQMVDLRSNPSLVIMGTSSLMEIEESLEEIRLPMSMKYIAPQSLNSLPKLKSVSFEGDEDPSLQNMIVDESGFFGDICCGLGEAVDVGGTDFPPTACDLQRSSPGIDSVYESFIRYVDATPIQFLTPSSTFMAEAAESAEKCAEYCTIDEDCKYFSFDARLPNAEHGCFLLADNGTSQDEICCDADHYADEAGTIPGWISGRPPQTRHKQDNAQVVYTTSDLGLSEENQFLTEYFVSLGSSPLRGAVWVQPVVVSAPAGMEFSVYPPRIALYDSGSSQTISVSASKISKSSAAGTLVIRNKIIACDEAFTFTDDSNEGLVYITVTPPDEPDALKLGLAIGVPLVLITMMGLAAFLWYDHKQRQNDMVWIVKKEELKFADPPEIIGRGTFGMVLLGEYRGTQVAVKRVIPAKANKKSSLVNEGSASGNDSIYGGSTNRLSESDSTDDKGNAMDKSDRENNIGLRSGASIGANYTKGTSSGYSMGKSSWGNFSLGLGSTSKQNKNTFSLRNTGKRSNEAATWRKLKHEFMDEMRHLSKMRHPCVTTVMGAVIGKNDVEPMLVMEYMEHGSLYDILHNETFVIEAEMALAFLNDISQGIRFLHSADPPVIHGDLKAANILVDTKFRAKVADFGLSQKKHLGGTGTPFWMAPELLRMESTNTPATDVFSFGVILYEVYSRREPYEGEDPVEVLKLVADKEIQKRPAIPSHCPPQIQSLMRDCFVDDPEKRPTFDEMGSRLNRIDANEVESAANARKQPSSISLFDIFPRHIAEALRDGRNVEPEHRDCVTIFFCDIVDFTSTSSLLPPRKVADLLDRLYSKFDALSQKHDIFKVETIGDAYMAVTNLVKDQHDDHAKRIALFACDAIKAANETQINTDDPGMGFVNIRVGFHSGSVVADVVGTRNPRYCLFGDVVNTSHRMESNSKSNRIHCSSTSAELLQEQAPEIPLRSRGLISIKGKGEMHTYWVNEASVPGTRKSEKRTRLSGIEQALANVDEKGESGMFSVEQGKVDQALANVDEKGESGMFSVEQGKVDAPIISVEHGKVGAPADDRLPGEYFV